MKRHPNLLNIKQKVLQLYLKLKSVLVQDDVKLHFFNEKQSDLCW